ncbi:XRE family transcriptional regulator [Kibdelosporangium aridum]|uniref:XRE family transcriptional regulator n=1 Tax=Kibdelosporangium aridum TaxID=2030 RepID=A0A428Z683_KIBAR|nr:helix-turn-helix transcriptional regulator [Kibdelosporangium aridum]RSM82574.1 XRE family transcriptional regulator [Kibdelosporangium aridum]
MTGRIDVAGLYEALDAERQARGLSWRQLAGEVGVSASLLSRMAKGHKPDLESFAALVQWLGVPAEEFMRDLADEADQDTSPAFETKLMPLLRAERDLNDEDREYLMQMVTATMKYLRANRQDS